MIRSINAILLILASFTSVVFGAHSFLAVSDVIIGIAILD